MSLLALRPSPSAFRLVMMGTGDFAVPTFRRLLDQSYQVLVLVTQPDRPQGRHQQLLPAPIKQLAQERGIGVFQPENVNTPESISRIAALRPDLFVVSAYGQILSDSLLGVPRLGGVNLHASLLPKYRGAAPVNWAIYHGETVTGVTVIQMTPLVDSGAILLQAETPIGPEETAGELELRLAELGTPLVVQAIDGLAAGTLVGRKQDRSLASRAPKLKKEDGLIDWSRDGAAISNQIRALQPWPMAYTFLYRADGSRPERIIIEQSKVAMVHMDSPDAKARPGDLIVVTPVERKDTGRLIVVTGVRHAAVQVDRMRPAGKRSMSVTDFLRGNRVGVGDRFGAEA